MEFVYSTNFERGIEHLEITDESLIQLENLIVIDPNIGAILQGIGGFRKLRISLPGRGKSGGARVIFIVLLKKNITYFLTAYGKKEKLNLTLADRKWLKQQASLLD